jgi:aminopeptidase N
MRATFLFALLSITMLACKYVPFITYYSQSKKTDLPTFSKKLEFAGTVNEYRAYDIIEYDWLVKVDPDKERIASTMKIDFNFESDTDVILLDLQRKLKVGDIISSKKLNEWKHRGDLLYIFFDQIGTKGEEVSLEITYQGKPAIIAKEGPIQWKQDKNGRPWVSTQTEGVGAHFMMPCKELLYDEPERCFLRVSVSDGLKVVANGSLDSVTTEGRYQTFHHSLMNPINIYNISFNIGDYDSYIEPYHDITGATRQIEVHALTYDLDSARKIYRQTPLHVAVLEQLYGEFPWWTDGCKIVQTTLGGSAMEHQSAISMGSYLYNDYRPPRDSLHVNTTLIHELAHEWWGNLVTGYDYCDMWIHEGMATYSEALVVEQLYEPLYYDVYIRWLADKVDNERPILKTCGVRYNSWVSYKDGDIYNKGALLMHTMRMQLNDDELFFRTLKSAISQFRKQNISTDQLVSYFDEQTDLNLVALFDIYLRYAEPPTLQYQYDSLQGKVAYRWEEALKAEFPLRVEMTVDNLSTSLIPTSEFQEVKVMNRPTFDVADFGYVLIEELGVD